MTDSELVHLSVDGGVATVTLDSPSSPTGSAPPATPPMSEPWCSPIPGVPSALVPISPRRQPAP